MSRKEIIWELLEKSNHGTKEEDVERIFDAGVVYSLRSLTSEERLELFSKFCTHCGDDNPSCPCWRDE